MQTPLFSIACLYLTYYCVTFSTKLFKKENRLGGVAVICLNLFLIVATIFLYLLQ